MFGSGRGWVAICAVCAACAGRDPAPGAREEPASPAEPPDAGAAGAAARADAAPAPGEAAARAILAAPLRRAGLRVLFDHRVRRGELDVTLDGYDPEREVGFEYVAPSERHTDLDARERALLEAGVAGRVLVVDPVPAAELRAIANRFAAAARQR